MLEYTWIQTSWSYGCTRSRAGEQTRLTAQPAPRSVRVRASVCAADRVAISQLRGVALQCRVSVPSRLTDCKQVGRGSHSPNRPLLARSSPLPAEGRDTKVRVAISAWHGLALPRTASPVRSASDSRSGVGALYAPLKQGWCSSSNSITWDSQGSNWRRGEDRRLACSAAQRRCILFAR